MRRFFFELILLAIAVGLTVEIIKPLIPYLPLIWLAILTHYTWEAITSDTVTVRARVIKARLSRRQVVVSYFVVGTIGAALLIFYWWGLNRLLGPKIAAYEAEQHPKVAETRPSTPQPESEISPPSHGLQMLTSDVFAKDRIEMKPTPR